ncbi:MAG: O-antigen ligase family protein, partial [Candidatus Limnocylindrales bacterium]
MQATEQTRLSQPPLRAAREWPRPAAAAWQQTVLDQLLKASVTAFVFVAVLVVTALNEHPIPVSHVGLVAQFIRTPLPLAAACVVTWAIYRPWPAYLAVLLLTPVWNAAQMEWQVGPVQVILQTVFAAALIAGCVIESRARSRTRPIANPLWLDDRVARSAPAESLSLLARIGRRAAAFEGRRFAELALVGFVGLAVLSTLASPDVTNSATVLLHGILEPVAMGAVLVWLRPSRRDLVMVGAALGVSIALGSLLNFLQTVPEYGSLAGMQAARLLFAHTTFFNVGLFGVIIAMVVPLLVGAIAARRALGLSPRAVYFLLVLLGLTLAGLFFSFSKSAWLATSIGTAILLLLLVPTWRRRLAMIAAVAVVSATFIPWPAFVLQVAPPLNSAYRTVAVSLVGEARFDSWNPTTLAGRGSMSERFYAVDGGVRMAFDHSLLGVGLDEFGTYYSAMGYRPAAARDALDHAHSVFPEVAAELGLPAMVLLAIAIAAALWAMWRTYRAARDQLTRILAATLFASLAAWTIAATAFGCDIYRGVRDMSSDVVAL